MIDEIEKAAECQECGMHVKAGEFHPFAACLMFKGCRNSGIVRANLAFFAAQDDKLRRVGEWVASFGDGRPCESPGCNDRGFTVCADRNGDPEQEQCEFCYMVADSVFNVSALRAILTPQERKAK